MSKKKEIKRALKLMKLLKGEPGQTIVGPSGPMGLQGPPCDCRCKRTELEED